MSDVNANCGKKVFYVDVTRNRVERRKRYDNRRKGLKKTIKEKKAASAPITF